ncbi:lysophospholipid acyltransferase family protein [Paraliomyxa miuraensis]|uniref:lysophospholipid acyltransferase family protein n=1 Tax=Paraliomyxa miuraensis TaxID=376150 RepID=UPI00224E78DD|nr:lysophospholipid acyltransferase family protein [Paraliomyxa miuraensis]MCX4242815.1 1-acyl-sn-glycerol-3-phosphate acyltransferase [Paraliomyxa miuraensis]
MSTNALVRVVDGTRAVFSWRRFIGLCLWYCPSSVVARALTGPKLPQIIMRRWCEGIVRDVGMRIAAEGVEKVAGKPSIIVANHASLLDIPALGSMLDIDYRWVAKKQLFRVPLVGWHLWACGHIPVDRRRAGNLERMQEMVEAVLAAGGSVVFFPEGTRSPDGALKAFRSGAFACAVEAGAPVLPIVLDGTYELLVKGSLNFPRGANRRVRVRVLDRVEVPRPSAPKGSDEHTAAIESLRDDVRRRMVDALDELRGGPGRAEQPPPPSP